VTSTMSSSSSSSSSSVAAPAVIDKHAEMLKMVNKCNHYKCTLVRQAQSHVMIFLTSLHTVVRSFCMHCNMILIDASPNTADCRLGGLCGCGARYCGIKCLVAASQAHKVVCENIQVALQVLAQSRFRATERTNQAAPELSGHVQIDLLRADMLVVASDVVDALVYVAGSLQRAEAFELAQKFAQRALSLSAKGSLDEASALDALGTVERHLSKYDAAVAHYEAALKITRPVLGDDHAVVAGLHANLSTMFQQLGRLDEALAMCSSALEIYSKAPGDNQKGIALCHNGMGNILSLQGKKDRAMESYSIGLAITLKCEGETARAADFLVNIGTVLAEQKRLDEAMEKYVSALSICERAKSDTRVALCHHNIGNLLMQQGKLDEALEHARKSLAIRRSKLSHEHTQCGGNHVLIGNILMRSGKFAAALDEFENALRIRKNVFGEMTLEVAEVYQNMAACSFNLRKWREAVTFYEATIHIRTVLLGADDASLVELKADLADAEEMLQAERSSVERK
jgi:tetratricopeptide (TPR) repeat protein